MAIKLVKPLSTKDNRYMITGDYNDGDYVYSEGTFKESELGLITLLVDYYDHTDLYDKHKLDIREESWDAFELYIKEVLGFENIDDDTLDTLNDFVFEYAPMETSWGCYCHTLGSVEITLNGVTYTDIAYTREDIIAEVKNQIADIKERFS